MKLRFAVNLATCLCILQTSALASDEVRQVPESSLCAAAKDSADISSAITRPVFTEVTQLIRTFYPNAKVTENGAKLHFEYKVMPHMSVSTNRPELAPKDGGILGDVEIKRGISKIAAKSVNDYYYLTDTITPYSANHDCCLNAKLSYPPETSVEFLEKFKTVVKDFDSLLPPPPVSQQASLHTTQTSKGPDNSVSAAVSNANPSMSANASSAPLAVAPVKPAALAKKLFFWKARRGPDVVYLCGTIHTAPPTLYPLAREIEHAFDESKCLVVEVDISKRKVDPSKIHQLVETTGKYTPPDKLSKHLSPSTKRIFEAYLNWAGESWAMYEPYKPWYVRELVTASVPRRGDISKLRKALGIDLHFLARASAAKKMVEEFETVDFQLTLDSKLAPDVQDALLQVSLLEMKDTDTLLANIFDAWKRGDMDKMERTAGHQDNPDLAPYAKALLDNRNIGMAAKIEPFLKTKGSPLFVAVGSAHMVGETGLVNLLKKKGFEVEQVTAETVAPD